MKLDKGEYNNALKCLQKYDYNYKNINKCKNEYNAVEQAKLLLNNDCIYIFEEVFRKKRNKWDVMDELGMSEPTYKRRRQLLIYTVNDELKKIKEDETKLI